MIDVKLKLFKTNLSEICRFPLNNQVYKVKHIILVKEGPYFGLIKTMIINEKDVCIFYTNLKL